MKAVFDTNILIDYLNGFQEAATELALYERRTISVISEIEVLVGAKSEEQERIIRGFLSTFSIVPVEAEIASMAVALRRAHGLKVPDAIVYATARKESCLFVTRNTKEFDEECPDIRVPYEI